MLSAHTTLHSAPLFYLHKMNNLASVDVWGGTRDSKTNRGKSAEFYNDTANSVLHGRAPLTHEQNNDILGRLAILTDSVVPYFRPCFRVCSYAIWLHNQSLCKKLYQRCSILFYNTIFSNIIHCYIVLFYYQWFFLLKLWFWSHIA